MIETGRYRNHSDMPMTATTPRIAPAAAPYPPAIQAAFDRLMPPGVPPLALFTTLARDPRLFGKFFAGSLLDAGHLTLRQREIVIDRTTARCGSDYEWSVHIAFFAERAGFDAAQRRSLAHGQAGDPCWGEEDRVLIELCDALHERCDIDEPLWQRLHAAFSDEAVLELLMLAGFYRTVSYLTQALRLPLEPVAARCTLADHVSPPV
jgi:alkylhydroperoxidase family enzyme